MLVVGPRSVLDNVWTGHGRAVAAEPAGGREAGARARHCWPSCSATPPALDRAVEELSLSDRQAISIVRALVREPKVLILDEATSALDVETRDRLFAIVARLASEGTGVVFISHRMDEIEQLGDRITVMRSGDTVATVDRGSTSLRELVRLMTGAEHLTGEAGDRSARHNIGDEVLHARDLVLRPGARPIDFRLRAGEIVGLAGLEGHGQATFLLALRGQGGFGGAVLPAAGPGAADLAA